VADQPRAGVAYASQAVQPFSRRVETSGAPPQPALQRLAARLDWFDWALFAVLVAQSMWMVVRFLIRQSPDNVWIGAQGLRLNDQLQYLGWVQDAAHGGFIHNLFQFQASDRSFLHPGFVASGALVRAGLSSSMAYFLWQPIAVIALFATVRAYVRRLLQQTWHRRIALVLAFFAVTPIVLVDQGSSDLRNLAFETWTGRALWGYPFTAIAIAAFLGTLLLYERDRISPRVPVGAPILGLVCAWLQPWQGATLIVVLIVAEALQSRRRVGNLLLPLVTVVATAAPLVYYLLLVRGDSFWKFFDTVSEGNLPSWPVLLIGLAPLAVPAVLAYRRRPRAFQDVAVRAWPVAALAIYALIAVTDTGTLAAHALQGLAIPLAVLAVAGFASIRLPVSGRAATAIVVALVVVLVVPGLAYEFDDANDAVESTTESYFVPRVEEKAFSYMEDSDEAGGVLAPASVGGLVPGLTGRRTWVGLPSWTPGYEFRREATERFFGRRMPSAERVKLVLESGAKFVFADCKHRRNLRAALRPVLVDVRRFGCATVYQIVSSKRG
jgi:hypothetical protein